MNANFSCPRTCPLAKETWCRFRPLLDRIGPVRVNSQTAKIQVDFNDPVSLKMAVESLGGKWLGMGTHRLYDGETIGFGFTMPNWRYPLVAQDGQLAYDDYHGNWGNVADLEKLRSEYALVTAEQGAKLQGWLCERTAEGSLLIHHPQGGTLTVTASGLVDMTGFQGSGCHQALLDLGLSLQDIQAKPEFSQTAVSVQVGA